MARDLASLSRVFISRRYFVRHSVIIMVRAVRKEEGGGVRNDTHTGRPRILPALSAPIHDQDYASKGFLFLNFF